MKKAIKLSKFKKHTPMNFINGDIVICKEGNKGVYKKGEKYMVLQDSTPSIIEIEVKTKEHPEGRSWSATASRFEKSRLEIGDKVQVCVMTAYAKDDGLIMDGIYTITEFYPSNRIYFKVGKGEWWLKLKTGSGFNIEEVFNLYNEPAKPQQQIKIELEYI